MTKDNTKAYGMQEYLAAVPCLRRMRCTAYLRVNGLLDVEAGLLDTKAVDVVAAMVRSLFRLCSAIEGEYRRFVGLQIKPGFHQKCRHQ